MSCRYCGGDMLPERAEAGYTYCLSEPCQAQGLHESERAFREEYTVGLLHKSNFVWVKRSELRSLNVRADLES